MRRLLAPALFAALTAGGCTTLESDDSEGDGPPGNPPPEAPVCAPGQELCSGLCVDVSTSDVHCGHCGNPCPAGTQCGGGVCSCEPGRKACAGVCVDFVSDGASSLIEAHTPNDSPLLAPVVLEIRVVDPEVSKIEWIVDGASITTDGGECFDATELGSGTHEVMARVYDDSPSVRDGHDIPEQSVTWTIEAPQ